MTARYWVRGTDCLFQDGVTWPDGLRLARSAEGLGRPPAPSAQVPGAAWRLVEDDGAPPELDGRQVELLLRYEDGIPSVAVRSVVR